MKYIVIILLSLICFSTNAQTISTIAGIGDRTNTGDGGPASLAAIYITGGLLFDDTANLIITTANTDLVRKINTRGIISTIAGTGAGGFSGDGGLATLATFNNIQFAALDSMGNIYLTDFANIRIRKIEIATGIIRTIAGTGTAGFSGDGGQATAAKLNYPEGICIDKKRGNLYFSDVANQRIRKISPSGIISTIAGTGIAGYNGDGGLADTSKIWLVPCMCIDDTGCLYFSDQNNGRVRKIDTFGFIHTIAGTGVAGYSGDGGPATAAELIPDDIVCDKLGNVYFGDTYHDVIRKIDRAGNISAVAGTGTEGFSGDGGPATAAEVFNPFGMAIDKCQNLYFGDGGNARIRKITFYSATTPVVTLAAPTSAAVSSTVSLTALLAGGCTCTNDTVIWKNKGIVFATTTTLNTTYTKATGTDSITATVIGCGDTAVSAVYVVTTSRTGIPLLSNTEYFQLYPNPAQTTAYLSSASQELGNISITNLLGQLQSVTISRPSTTDATIDLRSLSPGFYLVRCGSYVGRLEKK